MNSSTAFLIGAIVIAVVSIPLILKVVPPNHLYGFRTPSTLSNRALWYRANAFAGWALLIAAVASITLNLGMDRDALPEWAYGPVVFVLPLVVGAIACFIYLRTQSGGASESR